jgi:uncharacterized protein
MRWQGREQSDNVEDRRRMPVGGGVAMGGGLGMVVLALIVMFLGGDPMQLLQQAQQPGAAVQPQVNERVIEQQKEIEQFVRVVLKDTEDVWADLTPELRQITKNRSFVYQEPVLVLFSGRVNSACGMASAAVGPFYCPADRKVYLDLEFFTELQQRFKAPGDFAMAYVVAHEVGHHLQSLLGISTQVQKQQAQSSKVEGNQLSVRLELQADYLAGVWAARNQKMKNVLEAGDLKEALNAATRIGDDILQRQATGTVRPDAFTHGTARQREKWLRLGIETGNLSRLMEPFEVEYDEL